MDDETARLLAAEKRVRGGILAVAAGSLLHLVVVIAILSQLPPGPLPGWVIPLFLSLAIGPVLLVILRVVRNSLHADAAIAAARAAMRSIDELEEEIEKVKRERRRD